MRKNYSQYCAAFYCRMMVNNELYKIVIVASWVVVTAFSEVTKEKHENLSEDNLSHSRNSIKHLLYRKQKHYCLSQLAVSKDI